VLDDSQSGSEEKCFRSVSWKQNQK